MAREPNHPPPGGEGSHAREGAGEGASRDARKDDKEGASRDAGQPAVRREPAGELSPTGLARASRDVTLETRLGLADRLERLGLPLLATRALDGAARMEGRRPEISERSARLLLG
ncbi:MAG: hypothetical protein RBU30_23175, partial [Polyangia bacterium]|nr:hypothetical protein [Polyangia bacterium]